MGQSKVLYRVGQAVCRPIMKVFYRYKFINNNSIPHEGAYIIASNHMSFSDPVLLGLGQRRRLFFMAKQGLFKNKFCCWDFGIFKAKCWHNRCCWWS